MWNHPGYTSLASAADRLPRRVVLVAEAVEEHPTVSPGAKGLPNNRKLTEFFSHRHSLGGVRELSQTIRYGIAVS